MKILEGLSRDPNQVYILKKSSFGLKQASRQWHIKLLDEVKFLRYVQSKTDYSLFLKKMIK